MKDSYLDYIDDVTSVVNDDEMEDIDEADYRAKISEVKDGDVDNSDVAYNGVRTNVENRGKMENKVTWLTMKWGIGWLARWYSGLIGYKWTWWFSETGVGEFSDNDDAEEARQVNNDSDGIVDYHDDHTDMGDSVVVKSISNDDERQAEVSQMRTRIQTFVLTFRRRTRYLGDQIGSKNI